jgi:hypothetical protein
VDDVVPGNTVTPGLKAKWIENYDNRARKTRLGLDARELGYPSDDELSIPPPFDRVYALWVIASIHLHMQDYADFNNVMRLYNEVFWEWADHLISHEPPASGPRVSKLW